MRVLVTGSRGFIGANLAAHLRELGGVDVLEFHRGVAPAELPGLVAGCEIIFHAAGINRPRDPAEFVQGNVGLTSAVVTAAMAQERPIRIVLCSSSQAGLENSYGRSKRAAEDMVLDYGILCGAGCLVYRLPNVFGKWARPDYNSAVATFCHRAARGIPITVHEPAASLRLVYIDDVCREFGSVLEAPPGPPPDRDAMFRTVAPVYDTTVGEVAGIIEGFQVLRENRAVDRVGCGLRRALYATYLSALPLEDFAYGLEPHIDHRGGFAEVLRTSDSGQFSYFTAHPGVTRGGHYHHTKSEKFLVLHGQARFRFRNIRTGESHTLETRGDKPCVVETIPGWAHDITNVGCDELIVMLWANETFDPARPDTFARALE